MLPPPQIRYAVLYPKVLSCLKSASCLQPRQDEAAKLTAEMEARHARELKELDAREKAAAAAPAAATPAAVAAGAGAAAEADGAAEALDGLALGGGHKVRRPAAAGGRSLQEA